MDDTLDINVLDIPILNNYWCGICHQDIPVDDRSPNDLMRHICIWDLFRKVANYYGMKIDWAMCRTCRIYLRIPDGDIGGLIQHLNKSWCKDYVRQEYGLPKTWLGVEMSYEGPLN